MPIQSKKKTTAVVVPKQQQPVVSTAAATKKKTAVPTKAKATTAKVVEPVVVETPVDDPSVLSMVESAVKDVSEHPEHFIDKPTQIQQLTTKVLERLYNYSKAKEVQPTDALDRLMLEGFDNEQIWAQIQLFNDPMLDYITKQVQMLQQNDDDEDEDDEDADQYSEDDYELEDDEELEDDAEFSDEGDLQDGSFDDDGISGSLEDEDDDEQLDDDDEDNEEFDDDELDGEDDDEDLEDDDEEDGDEDQKLMSRPATKGKDMNFFNQEEMEKFLDDADEEERDSDKSEDFDEDDEDEEGGFGFAEGEMDEEEARLDKLLDKYIEKEGVAKKEKTKQVKPEDMKFDDFFKNPDEDEEEEFPMERDDDDMDDDDLDLDDDLAEDATAGDDSESTLPKEELSAFEKRAQKVQERIRELEKQNLKKKKWTVIGEAAAKDRPVNSLLEEHLDFEYTQKVAPVITEETNKSLEDIIKKRIFEKNFSDVIRKTEEEFEQKFKAKVELNDQKNAEGLSSVYEKDFLTKAMGVELTDETKEKHEKIHTLLEALMYKLDSLTNFNYTPKRIKNKELNITNTQSISIEEKIPVATSTAQLVAPEEVYFKQNADEKGYSEMSKEEKKQLRSKTKEMWRKDKKEKDAKELKAEKTNANLAKRNETRRAMEHLKASRNTTIIDPSKTRKHISSGNVFAKLQEEQDNKRKGGDDSNGNGNRNSKKPKVSNESGAKFKL
ncbi:hypothetical protein SAMD00019534_004930 [Acytostelium subglobosum LB1]|uniref:hypothetical protein n=1 Tax=Acytostelium subglobosum LB1 TaxID=1410327 RepID=UPI000644D46E|nr:hypothetical protein SAMD00019534_004930 [Acytostelium subglobosum LB1]GAM17318.1 hypothetical protein SAMD00019534_004930 [Acytostelium subglobosum LB1]|eukprot:XP_012759380.1 hypothetical protein SAMD00019534_004930 [Acytostelium subglobosum LB1]